MPDAPAQPSCRDLSLNAPGFTELVAAASAQERRWSTPDGDTLVLRRLDGPSPYAGAASAQELAGRLETAIAQEGGDWLELKLTRFGERPAVQTVVKHPQPNDGVTYTAALHLPLQTFAFELSLRCEETGEPGQREQRLLNRILAEGDQWTMGEGGRIVLDDWDPDNVRHDKDFPKHPLSRARRGMGAAIEGLDVGAALEGWPSAALPG